MVDMSYSKEGSSASTDKLIKKLFTDYGVKCSKDKKDIEWTLRGYKDGIIIISSRTKSDFMGIFPRGSGHAYVADGFKKFKNGTSLIHINMGWGGYMNGYYLENLVSPQFTDDVPEECNFGHEWKFYCLHK